VTQRRAKTVELATVLIWTLAGCAILVEALQSMHAGFVAYVAVAISVVVVALILWGVLSRRRAP